MTRPRTTKPNPTSSRYQPMQQPARDPDATFPPGTFTRVYAPYVDPVRRVWVWPPRPDWSGVPESERKEQRR